MAGCELIMVLPRDIDAYLTRRFYDSKAPGSFTSTAKLHSVIKKEGRYSISLRRINEWAKTQDIVTLHKSARQSQPRYRRIIAPGMNHMWDCDLLVLVGNRFKEANDGFAYILVTVDVFSRYCRAEAAKTKGSKDMVAAFEKIFERTAELPNFTRQDRGTEFTAKPVTNLLKGKGIQMIYPNTETKANYAEAAIKSLKKRLFQFFQHTNSYRYIDTLQDIVKSYNATIHSSIGTSPDKVTRQNEQDIWDFQYIAQNTKDLYKLFKSAVSSARSRKRLRFKFAIGDKVRVSYHRKKNFTRSYDEQFSGEVFTIRARKYSDNVAVYYLDDFGGETVDGPFYTSELTPVKFDPDAFFKIEKVIKTRTRAGVKESLVKYQSWPSKYNQWLPTSSIKTLKRKKTSNQPSD